nr:MAG TPA: hypothetical protein [Caudoviricetes sp.]
MPPFIIRRPPLTKNFKKLFLSQDDGYVCALPGMC